ncbi:probable threonine aldolase [Phialocephala subalpina]|uniref:Probable threonine aldolase n=1 Tax=Phialocephala subalpina TaxID=576137 RepID=A0A1L7WMA1_9HELO|nr:probable threonine aldolase [Phialocephala subalpina]
MILRSPTFAVTARCFSSSTPLPRSVTLSKFAEANLLIARDKAPSPTFTINRHQSADNKTRAIASRQYKAAINKKKRLFTIHRHYSKDNEQAIAKIKQHGIHTRPKMSTEHPQQNGINGQKGINGLGGTTDLPPADGPQKQQNAWSGPGPAAFDFRSDVVTTPTPSMLSAVQNTTLLDDVFMEDPTTISLESHMATLTSHEASLFVLSGTMGNQLAIRSHLTQPPHSILCDYRAHILEWEAGGVATLSGALVKGVVPSNGVYLTLEDVRKNVVIGDEIHGAPTRVISLENTLGGTIMPLEEVRKIAAFAREHEIKMHLDGARLWEAVVAGAGSLPDYTKEFDSVSLCFSKGLGAPVGSILVGSKKFIKQARWVRKSIGGGLRQPGVVTAAARVAVDETFGKDLNGQAGLLKQSHITARRIAKIWTDMGGKLDKPTETNMVWFDLDDVGLSGDEFAELGKKHGLRLLGGRLVVHYQISDEAVNRLEVVMKEAMAKKGTNGSVGKKVGEKAYGT